MNLGFSLLEVADTLHVGLLNGGASINPTDGSKPTRGYMVSTPGAEIRTRSVPTRRMIQTWLEDLAIPECLVLEGQNATPYVGAWSGDGFHYLDVSVCVLSREDAETLGRKWGQVAIYDIDRGETITLGRLVG